MEQLHALCFHLNVKLSQACEVTSRAIEALNEPELDWVDTDSKDNWYCFCCCFGGEYGRGIDRGDHSNIASAEFGGQLRPLVTLPVGPLIFNPSFTAFTIPASAETLMECCHEVFVVLADAVSR